MPITRLFILAPLLFALMAFAQDKQRVPGSIPSISPAHGLWAEAPNPSEPWRIIPEPPASSHSTMNPADRFADERVFQMSPDCRSGISKRLDSNQIVVLRSLGNLGLPEGDVCYTMRTYVVARDEKDSDSTHPVSSSTCQPASRYGVKKAGP